MAFTAAIAADVTAKTLERYIRESDPKQILKHVLNKPLLRVLEKTKKEFKSAGAGSGTTTPPNVREPVMGSLMRDNPTAYSGWAADDVVTFGASSGLIQTSCPVRNMHCGWTVSHDELAQQGVIVTNNKASPTPAEITNLVDALELMRADYAEAVMYGRNNTLWLDGTQDAKAIAGIKSILTDDPTVGTCLGINRATAPWFRHIADTGVGGAGSKLAYSKSDQTLTERLDFVINILLPLYGGNPDVSFAGADIIGALKKEAHAKGSLTVTGWKDENDLDIGGFVFGKLKIVHDPTLDLLGESKSIYIWDSNHLKLRPQSGHWGKVTPQNQPSNQFIMLTSTTDRGVVTQNQPDSSYKGVMQ